MAIDCVYISSLRYTTSDKKENYTRKNSWMNNFRDLREQIKLNDFFGYLRI